jgi:prephenate dehydrogenase
MKPKKVGIIGIKGKFGQWFKWFFEKHGCDVWGSDLNTATSAQDVVKWAEVVVICVPLPVVEPLIKAAMKDALIDQLWIDISSVKSDITMTLLRSRVEFISMHPLFAPQKGLSWKGEKVVIVNSRAPLWNDWAQSFFRKTGALYTVKEMSLHDRHMLGSQNGVHALALAHLNMCRELKLEPEELLELSTRLSSRQLAISARILSNSPGVYADIQLCNPGSLDALDSQIEFLIGLRKAVRNGDGEWIIAMIDSLREYLGEDIMKKILKDFK